MKKEYTNPQIAVKHFALENILTASSDYVTNSQIEDIRAKMNLESETTFTELIQFNKWN